MPSRAVRTACVLALIGAGTVQPAGLRAQALAPMLGTSAIQSSLQTAPASGAAGSLERSRSASSQIQAANQATQGAIDTLTVPQSSGSGSGGAAPAAATGQGTSAAPQPAPAGSSRLARVNGRTIPTCSHGGLCHRALLQAIGAGR